jgi:hypothetical protein
VGFEGNYQKSILKLKNKSAELPIVVTRFPKKDSLQIWFKSDLADSLKLEITSKQLQQNFIIKKKLQTTDHYC